MSEYIPYGRQSISEEDIKAVVDVLRSDFITQGPKVPEFEKSVADYCDVKHAVAVNSATSALHLACLALGVGAGDYVWTSPITFVASANCALYCGASVDFVDIDSRTYNMSPLALEEKLKSAQKENKLPKVVIPVHLAGQSCDMQKIKKLSKEYGFSIIEDASHAIGGRYQNKHIGSCEYSDVCVFSFHPVKVMTTAEGGMAVTHNSKVAEKMQRLRSHGITRDKELMQSVDGPWSYEQIELGFNYRMTELQAALGISQLKRLDEFIKMRHEKVALYNHALEESDVELPFQCPESYSAFHLYIVQVENRRDVFERMRENGIGVNVHYIPVHTQPFYQNLGFKKGDFPIAEAYYEKAMSLPLFPDLREQQVTRVCDSLRRRD
jgi:UDP-4-amino-4,6-dideoxy-N-acetyl-beta-L-altrosamine transaminase